MVQVDKDDATGGCGQPGVILVIPGGDTEGPTIWSGLLRIVGRNDQYGGQYPCGVPTPYHNEAGNMARRRAMRDTGGQGGDMGSGDSVGGHIHRPLEIEGITVQMGITG